MAHGKKKLRGVSPPELSQRVRGLRGELGKAGFGRLVGVHRTLLVAAEEGKRPSIEVLLKLGNFASGQGRHEDAIWFWELAGLSSGALIREALAESRAASEAMYLIYPSRKVGAESENEPIPFAAKLAPEGGLTSYLTLTDKFYAPLLHAGDMVIVDESITEPEMLIGECVALYRPKKGRIARIKNAVTGEVVERQIAPFIRDGIFAGWFVPDLGDDRKFGVFLRVPTTGGLLEECSGSEMAASNITVLGRVVAWIPRRRTKAEREERRVRTLEDRSLDWRSEDFSAPQHPAARHRKKRKAQ